MSNWEGMDEAINSISPQQRKEVKEFLDRLSKTKVGFFSKCKQISKKFNLDMSTSMSLVKAWNIYKL